MNLFVQNNNQHFMFLIHFVKNRNFKRSYKNILFNNFLKSYIIVKNLKEILKKFSNLEPRVPSRIKDKPNEFQVII